MAARKSQAFYFNPEGKGLEMFLGPMEARLMELVWKYGELTVKTARFHLENDVAEPEPSDDTAPAGEKGTSKPNKGNKAKLSQPAYTTVMTELSRLAEKGMLTRKKRGRNFVYSPAMSRDEFLRSRIQHLIRALEQHHQFRACW